LTGSPYLSPPLEIERAFLDHNGHVNMAYHLVLADRALDLAFQPIKGEDYVEQRGMTTFAVELHVRYRREIAFGDEIRGRVRWLACDDKRIHWSVELVRGTDHEVATTVEGLSLSISLAIRAAAPFPADIGARFAEGVARDAPAAAALDWIGRRVAMSKT
jgi:acyl-CoA thioester hydrolase